MNKAGHARVSDLRAARSDRPLDGLGQQSREGLTIVMRSLFDISTTPAAWETWESHDDPDTLLVKCGRLSCGSTTTTDLAPSRTIANKRIETEVAAMHPGAREELCSFITRITCDLTFFPSRTARDLLLIPNLAAHLALLDGACYELQQSPRSNMANSAPSVQVLTSESLFHDITAFASGVPFSVIRFKETEYVTHLASLANTALEHQQTSDNDSKPSASVQSLESNKTSWRQQQEQDPSTELKLWHVAVLRKNRTVVRILNALSRTSPEYADNEHIQMNGVVGFAALHHDRDLDTDFLEWIYSTCCDPHQRHISEQQFSTLATLKHLDAVQWIHEHGYAFPECMMDAAAECGNLSLVRFLHEHTSTTCTTAAMDSAARNGHLEVVKFLHEHRSEGCTSEAIGAALQNGYAEVVRFLHENRSEGCSPMAVCLAVIKGHLECVKYAHEHNFRGFGRPVLPYAVVYGHIDIVKFLHEHRSEEGCTFETLLNAERYEFHTITDFLCLQRPPKNPIQAFQEAAGRGFLRLALKIAYGAMWSTPAQRFEYAM